MPCFAGESVFVTGASSGIGAAVAREFAREGARVALTARRVEKLEAVRGDIEAEGGRAIAIVCDVCDRASIDAAVAETVAAFGGIDVVLANAGFGVSGDILRLSTEDFRRQFETNFFGVLDTMYATLPALEKAKGRLGIVSSVMGRVGLPASGPYNASKFALVGLSESIYFDLAERGISVSCIDPGLVASQIRVVSNEGQVTDNPDPAPAWLVMPAEKAARVIVRGLLRRKPEFVVTGHGKALCFLSRHFPRTTRFLLRRLSRGRIDKIAQAKRGTLAGK